MQIRLMISICAFFLSASSAFGQWEQLGKAIGLGSKTELGDTKIASGLKEALKIGAENAVKLTGKTDGYYRNDAIKILMPKNVRSLELIEAKIYRLSKYYKAIGILPQDFKYSAVVAQLS